ncbi:MAG TPA: entericidin A/B family lipoprotein [Chitinolyticbacter sp.]|nr:entericidin A/B family lipoprotein [Chitinolyticbacter albus]HSC78815.1 entericidin A/B family lipoprotein [Chitinolyticbacter sp.]
MKRLIALISLAAFTLLTACNTVHGVGKDIEKGGEKVQDAAEEAK